MGALDAQLNSVLDAPPRLAATDWLAVAGTVADRLAPDALERDRAGADPLAEIELLKESGLVTAIIPAAFGGGGAPWSQALAVVRRIAATDGSIAQLIGYHYVNLNEVALTGTPETIERISRASVDGRWLWADAVNPIEPDLVVTRDGDAYILNGSKTFATGASVGDVTVVAAVDHSDGAHVLLYVPRGSEGYAFSGDWDNLGQRLSASGGVTFTDVEVGAEQVLARLDPDRLTPFRTLVTPIIQAMFGHLYLGIAEGALARAAEYTRTSSRAWVFSEAPSASEDPYVLQTYGTLVASLQATAALAEKIGARIDELIAHRTAVTERERGELAVQVAALKVISTDAALEVTNKIFEVTGARATSNRFGLDIYWRNIRTHTLHDPIAYKRREVGAFYVNDRIPDFSLYT
jgi:alkylation response protein AidB-like acyl-CoA dehydrogenase